MVWGVVRNLVHCLCPIVDVTKFIDDKRVFILTIFSCGIELKPVLVPRQPPMDGNSVVEAKPKVSASCDDKDNMATMRKCENRHVFQFDPGEISASTPTKIQVWIKYNAGNVL